MVVDTRVPLRCIGFRKGTDIPCDKILMLVEPEHLEMVRQRIQIKCFHCGTIQ